MAFFTAILLLVVHSAAGVHSDAVGRQFPRGAAVFSASPNSTTVPPAKSVTTVPTQPAVFSAKSVSSSNNLSSNSTPILVVSFPVRHSLKSGYISPASTDNVFFFLISGNTLALGLPRILALAGPNLIVRAFFVAIGQMRAPNQLLLSSAARSSSDDVEISLISRGRSLTTRFGFRTVEIRELATRALIWFTGVDRNLFRMVDPAVVTPPVSMVTSREELRPRETSRRDVHVPPEIWQDILLSLPHIDQICSSFVCRDWAAIVQPNLDGLARHEANTSAIEAQEAERKNLEVLLRALSKSGKTLVLSKEWPTVESHPRQIQAIDDFIRKNEEAAHWNESRMLAYYNQRIGWQPSNRPKYVSGDTTAWSTDNLQYEIDKRVFSRAKARSQERAQIRSSNTTENDEGNPKKGEKQEKEKQGKGRDQEKEKKGKGGKQKKD